MQGKQNTFFLNESVKMPASEQFLYKKGLTRARESVKCTALPERWVSGWNQFPAKEPYAYTRIEGSNPSLSAIIRW